MTGKTGKYRIQTVAQLTGVSPATLRAWERRYGFPAPARTSSSYRLYSEHDVALIRRLVQLGDEGVAPSEAARALLAESGGAPSMTPELAVEPALESAREQIIEAVLAFSGDRLQALIRSVLFLAPAEIAVHRVLVPVLHEVGDRWHEGSLSVAHEHFASAIISTALHDLLRLSAPAQHGPRVLLACPADEEHSLPLYTVAFSLLRWGLHPVILGAKTPAEALRAAIVAINPVLVGLSLSTDLRPRQEAAVFRDYAGACAQTPWIVGGQASEQYEELVNEFGGQVARGGSPDDLAPHLEELMAHRRSGLGKPAREARVSRAKTKIDD